MSKPRNLTVRCPECQATLVVDSPTGEVLSHRKAKQPPAAGKDFEALLEDLDREKTEAEEVFAREVEAMKDRDRLLEEKFKQALERADAEPDDEPPIRPFDLD